MGMLLMLTNQLRKADREVREMQWNRESNRGFEIEGKTVAIIGYGVMGKAFAKRLSGFDCHVLAYDKYLENYGDQYASQASMQEIYERADIVSLHVPLKEDTKHLVNETWLKGFKKPIVLLNTSRGGVVQIAAVEAAIVQGEITGVGLDVLEYEESSFEKIDLNHPEFVSLAQRENVVLSPHVAGWTIESYIKLSSVLADKIDLVFKS
jgi:D-3-phosphoglycerate dehydrogenase